MNKSNNQNTIDQQYLKAMNIDLWVARDAPVATDNSAAVLSSTAVTQAEATDATPLAQLPATELRSALSSLSLTANLQAPGTELLVVTEDASLSDECLKLLGSMLKAIELADSQWLHTGIAQSNTGTSLNALDKSMPLKAVVLMLQTGGNTNALAQLRTTEHRVSGFQAPVMVTFHPQDLLDNPEAKRPAWEDLKLLRKWLG